MDTTAMDTTAIQPAVHDLRGARTIFWAGLIAGTLDLTGACAVSWLKAGVTPVRILQTGSQRITRSSFVYRWG